MPLVTTSIDINSSQQTVYEMAADMESFSQFMPNVKKVIVLEREGNETVTRWETTLQGRKFNWEERDTFYPEQLRITYHLTKGDLKKFEGEWTVTPLDDGSRLTLTVDFEFGIPMISAMLNPVAVIAVRDNCRKMLSAIKQAVEE